MAGQPLADHFPPWVSLEAARLLLYGLDNDLFVCQPPQLARPVADQGLGPKLIAIAAERIQVYQAID
jgi:hypothetical protein